MITSDSDWKYVNVRRLLIFIEASIERGLQWVVFEPNAEPLWARVRRTITNFLTVVWRNGALEGMKPEEAFFVKCDRTTMTQTDIDNGRLIVLVGVAPVKPAEFVIVRIGLWTARSDSLGEHADDRRPAGSVPHVQLPARDRRHRRRRVQRRQRPDVDRRRRRLPHRHGHPADRPQAHRPA